MRGDRDTSWKGRGIEAMASLPVEEAGTAKASDIAYIPYDPTNYQNKEREAMLVKALTGEVLEDLRSHRRSATHLAFA